MTLVVEDGSGVEGANSYIPLEYPIGYFTGDRLLKWDLAVEEQKELLLNATRYIDLAFDWQGKRMTRAQSLNWPRASVLFDGWVIEGIPAQVKKATAEAAWLILQGEDLFDGSGEDEEVASEQIDVIKITYRDRASSLAKSATRFDILNLMLRGLYKTISVSDTGGGVQSARVVRT